MLPVEDGHSGGELVVRNGLEVTKLDRSQDNGSTFYLSTSFIDCEHEISPVTKGWSVVLTYQLIWKENLVATPNGMHCPAFFSALKTVKQILAPLHSPLEDCDSEMLVIPLVNGYARVPLCYANLQWTDQLMASLLQSTNSLEIRLATVVNYWAGNAYNERLMNTNRSAPDLFAYSCKQDIF